MIERNYGNGDITTYTYNSLNLRLTRLSTVDKNGVAVQDLNYTYDLNPDGCVSLFCALFVDILCLGQRACRVVELQMFKNV